MADQKFCRNCGAPNLPDAKFCANCSNAFVSDDAAAPLTAASAAPMPSWQQPTYSPSPEPPTIFGISRKWVVIGIVALVLLLTLGCVAMASQSPSTPTPTADATVMATATVKPTATQAKVTATPKPAVSSTDYSNAIAQHWTGLGYSIATPFKKTTIDGKEAYQGALSRAGISYKVTVIVTDTGSQASSYADTRIANYKAQGYVTEKVETLENGGEITVLAQGTHNVGIGAYGIIYGTNGPGVGIMEYTSY